MKKLNLLVLCLAAIFCVSNTQAQTTISPWQIHEGTEGTINFTTKFHGDPAAYEKASIPGASDSGWSAAPTDANGNVNINRKSTLQCNKQLDFTYFQSSVNIPGNTRVDKFTVSYNKADDGARIYIFNSANPNGAFDAAADLQFNKKNSGNVDLKKYVKIGEVNRVVIVQFDDCGVGNTLNGINIQVNGEVIEVKKEPVPAIASKDFDPNKCYRLTSQWQGDSKSLDVINDGKNDKLQLSKTGAYSGQYWKLTPVGKGFYRLTTLFQGEGKSLDVINDGKNNQLQLAKTGNYSGQYWKLTPVGTGYYRLTSQWQGDDKSLDVINDGKNNQLQLAKTGGYSGQYWKLTEMDCAAAAPSTTASNTETALPDKFKVHAFSVNQGKGNQPDYWFGMTNNDSRGRILNDAQISSNGKLMEIETVSLGNNQYAFKVKNTGNEMYLTARDNKEVHVEKTSNGSVPEGAKFVSVEPLTAAPGANEKNYRSFQSVKFKDHYLRHAGYAMFVHPSNGTELFKQDASWLIQKM